MVTIILMEGIFDHVVEKEDKAFTLFGIKNGFKELAWPNDQRAGSAGESSVSVRPGVMPSVNLLSPFSLRKP